MRYRTRIYYNEAQKRAMWDRWQQGESLNSIARSYETRHSAIQTVFSHTGGIRPPQRRRSRLALTLAEREDISRGLASGQSIRSIATLLGRAPSTVSHEIERNGGCSRYRASLAEQAAWNRVPRPKRCKLVTNTTLACVVAQKLKRGWSSRQIAGWLKRTYPDDETFQVSHEIIFKVCSSRPVGR